MDPLHTSPTGDAPTAPDESGAGLASPASGLPLDAQDPGRAPAVASSNPIPAVPPPRAAPPSPVHRELDEIARELADGKRVIARTRLVALVAETDKSGSLDERIVAHALLGRIHDKAGSAQQAAAEYQKARDLWPGSAASVAAIGRPGEEQTVMYVRLGRALTGVGEALFFFAERTRARTVDPLRFPIYRGTPERPPTKRLEQMSDAERERELARRARESQAVKKHIDTAVKQWIEAKRKAIEDTEKEYARILDIQPVPPPRWVVAAAARVGQMWGGFADDFRLAPLPGWMKDDPAIAGEYQAQLESATRPLQERARSAFATCQSLAQKYRIDDEFSRICTTALPVNP